MAFEWRKGVKSKKEYPLQTVHIGMLLNEVSCIWDPV